MSTLDFNKFIIYLRFGQHKKNNAQFYRCLNLTIIPLNPSTIPSLKVLNKPNTALLTDNTICGGNEYFKELKKVK